LAASPENRPFRSAAESVRVEQCAVVMVSQERNLKVEAKVNALARIGTVADNVPQTEEATDSLSPNVTQDSQEGLQVAVNVTDNRNPGIF